jgi:hypothetical protein
MGDLSMKSIPAILSRRSGPPPDYYRPIDLAEKILNCRDLLDRWLPAQGAR